MTTKTFRIGSLLPIKKENSELFFQATEAICELKLHLSVLVEGDNGFQTECFKYAEKYPKCFEMLENNPKNKERVLSEVDAVIFFDSNPDKKLLEKVLSKGIVPIIPERSDFQNFDPQQESGNAFLFKKNSFWQFVTAIIRASENFKFTYDWRNLQANIKELSAAF